MPTNIVALLSVFTVSLLLQNQALILTSDYMSSPRTVLPCAYVMVSPAN